MKNALLIVNALLVVAVSFLMYKQCSHTSSAKPHAYNAPLADSLQGKRQLIAYIDLDSIEVHYELAKNVQKEISKKQSAVSYEMEKMEKSFKAKWAGYQQKGDAMSPAEADAARKDLEATQAQMLNKNKALTDDYNQFVATKNSSVRKKIEDFLKVYNAGGTYSFIFSYEPGFFYYRDSVYDITGDVLKGLNEQYKTEKR